ncbi:metalloaminopeptidase [Malassezia pachydermatis]|uniref:Creatinase aminopeptidase n=1 Tax=Malassezia pachydermatis TaxID=77020 RepID=A0A0M9VPT9_9BASI|nr:creatinase aminopeptidase [Malassezia pachydermatis]KOS14819.1 creatinase aminopeptidase [Malassezia pachydermatis]
MGAVSNGVVHTSSLVSQLREKMQGHNLQAYIVPSEDEHASEYPSDADLLRGYISGFSGSAGCALVTKDEALLFTDGRYFLQASQQLEPGVWTLMRMGEPGVPTWQEWLSALPPSSRVGVDPKVLSAEDAHSLQQSLAMHQSTLVPLAENLVAEVWPDRPSRPHEPIKALPESITGRAASDKIQELRASIRELNGTAFICTMLDEVAWLLNLRGDDVPFNPVFFAFAVVTLDACTLYVNESQLTDEVRAHLGSAVQIRPYDSFYTDLKTLSGRVLIGKRASWAVYETLGAEKAHSTRSIVVDQKSIKNKVEQDGFREAHIRDGAALVSYFAWLEEALANGESISEMEGANKLASFRAMQPDFQGLSFMTISSTGPNGAIIHYAPPEQGSPAIDPNDLYLCDSGAHFTFGTTDVTRTLHFGTPTMEQRRCFTRVLQGHIAVDRMIFPYNTTGYVLDALARAPAWRDHLEYRHGTGHGVGHYLNVHEPPMGLGTRIVFNETGLKEGMVISNEPGYYLDGHWGIRIENLVIVQPHKIDGPEPPTSKGFLQMEHITMCPIQTKLMDVSLMSVDERQWVNAYHDEVLEKLRPRLQNDARALRWLEKECSVRI